MSWFPTRAELLSRVAESTGYHSLCISCADQLTFQKTIPYFHSFSQSPFKMIKPFVTREHAISLASEIFNLDIDSSSQSTVKELVSYDDRNFYVRATKEGIEREYVLKVSNREDSEYEGLLEELNTVILHLVKGGIPCSVPQRTALGKCLELRQFVATPESHPVKRAKKDEEEPVLHKYAVRLFTFMPGKTIRDLRDVPCTTDLCFKVGCFVAEVHKVLKVWSGV